MGEILLKRVKSIYADLKGTYKSKVFSDESGLINKELVDIYNKKIEELSKVSESDYSDCKIPESCRHFEIYDGDPNKRETNLYENEIPKCNLERVLSKLESDYEFERENQTNMAPPVIIENRNEQNQISYTIHYNIKDLINNTKNEDEKEKLAELENELNKPDKNWDKIKNTLIWIMNFSKDLFIKVLPIILEKYGK